jgi:hypothetical protein
MNEGGQTRACRNMRAPTGASWSLCDGLRRGPLVSTGAFAAIKRHYLLRRSNGLGSW